MVKGDEIHLTEADDLVRLALGYDVRCRQSAKFALTPAAHAALETMQDASSRHVSFNGSRHVVSKKDASYKALDVTGQDPACVSDALDDAGTPIGELDADGDGVLDACATPTLTHAQAAIDLTQPTGEVPPGPPWLGAALAVFPDSLQSSFYALGCAESGLTAGAVSGENPNGTRDFSWLQINSRWYDGTAYPSVPAFPEAAKTDPVMAAVGALIVYGHQGLGAWSTWHGSADDTLEFAQSHGYCG